MERVLAHPLGITLLGIALLGTLVYWQYIQRALVHLDPKAVIPERVRLAFDVMTEGVVVLDSRGRVLLANRAFRGLPGDESADLAGRQLSELPWLAAGLPADAAEHPWMRAMHSGQAVMDFEIDVGPRPEDRARSWWSTVPRSALRAAGCAAAWRPSTTSPHCISPTKGCPMRWASCGRRATRSPRRTSSSSTWPRTMC